jgi:hypothetical protein
MKWEYRLTDLPVNCLVPPVICQDLRHLICEDVHVDRSFFCLPTPLVWTFECLRLFR